MIKPGQKPQSPNSPSYYFHYTPSFCLSLFHMVTSDWPAWDLNFRNSISSNKAVNSLSSIIFVYSFPCYRHYFPSNSCQFRGDPTSFILLMRKLITQRSWVTGLGSFNPRKEQSPELKLLNISSKFFHSSKTPTLRMEVSWRKHCTLHREANTFGSTWVA